MAIPIGGRGVKLLEEHYEEILRAVAARVQTLVARRTKRGARS